MGRKKVTITVTTRRVLLVRGRRELVMTWCAGCDEMVQMVTAEVAAAVAHVTVRTIYRWVEAGSVHFLEAEDGALLVCLESLSGLSA